MILELPWLEHLIHRSVLQELLENLTKVGISLVGLEYIIMESTIDYYILFRVASSVYAIYSLPAVQLSFPPAKSMERVIPKREAPEVPRPA